MTPEPPRTGSAALRVYQNYRYTVVAIINGAQPHTQEAELWYAARWTRAGRLAAGPTSVAMRPSAPGKGSSDRITERLVTEGR